MKHWLWVWSGWTLVVLLAFAPAGAAPKQDAGQRLRQAVALFEQQDYVAAQEELSAVDRERLSDRERKEYERLRDLLPQAIAGAETAAATLAEADRAFAAGRWDEADGGYAVVLKNEYARPELKSRATAQRARITEQRKLAESARPNGPAAPPVRVVEAQAPPPPPAEEPPGTPPPPPPESRRLTPSEERRLRDNLLWQRAVARSNALATEARDAAAAQRFEEARQLADQALQVIEAARNYAEPVAKYLAARDAAVRLAEEVAAAEQTYVTRRSEEQQIDIARRITERQQLIEQQKREKVEQLFNTAAQLRKQQRFDEAAEIYRQILHIEPANARARDLLEMAEDYASLREQRAWEDDLQKQTRESLLRAEEALIPWTFEVLYPKNWLELTARRSAQGVGTGESEEDNELHGKLNEVLPEFRFDQAPLGEVLDYLKDAREVNLAVDWEDLKANGIEPERPVSMQLRNLPFRTVLSELLAQVGGDVRLAYVVTGGLVRIATKTKLDEYKIALVYDVRDLLVGAPRFTNAAKLDPGAALGQVNNGVGSPGTQLFQSAVQTSSETATEAAAPATSGPGLVERVTEIIRQTVEPDSWQEVGGDGSIRELNGQLIIYNTSAAHSQIQGLLEQLRATRALQIAMEARFLSVTANFLEEFGIDLDFVFNQGSAGFDPAFSAGVPVIDPYTGSPVLIPRQFSRIGSTPLSPAFGNPTTQIPVQQPYGQPGFVPSGTGVSPHFQDMTPITAQQGSLALTNPSNINTSVPGSFAQRVTQPALNIAGSFLDNLQVDFLIRATQANQRSSVVQAPRLVMFNGQRANISIGRFRSYVSSVQPQIGEGAVGVQPIQGQANSGVVLDVEGTISADRRYVTMTVRTTQTEEPSFERFEVQRQSGNSPGIFILLPNQAFVTVNTTVSIPDGGTVLLGGLKQVGEIEVEAGVPILSKIPVVKRAFTNKTMVKDTRTLLILMKTKIIIQREAEEEAFPTFTAAGGGT